MVTNLYQISRTFSNIRKMTAIHTFQGVLLEHNLKLYFSLENLFEPDNQHIYGVQTFIIPNGGISILKVRKKSLYLFVDFILGILHRNTLWKYTII